MPQDRTGDISQNNRGLRAEQPVAPHEKTVISKRAKGGNSGGGNAGSGNRSAQSLIGSRASLEAGRTLEGLQLGHFRLEEFVGGGGMGSVYRATDLTLARTVAVKVVSLAHADEDTLRRFRNEAQSAARLDHPNIARVYFVDEDQGWSYIVFEFIEGVNIRDLVEDHGPLQIDEAISFTLDIAEALHHAAQREVVHRDIKPSNILVTPQGRAKLVDMGLARLHQVETVSNDLTAPGVTLGTFDYISPEQARDPRSADVRSDIYSLGCTLYFMLTGLPPFPDGTVLQKLLSHSSEPPPDPRILRNDLPPEVSVLLARMLAKQPSQRFQAPRDLTAALLSVAQKYELLIARNINTVWTPAPPIADSWLRRQLYWMVPAIFLALAVLAIEKLSPSAPPITREWSLVKRASPPSPLAAPRSTPLVTSEDHSLDVLEDVPEPRSPELGAEAPPASIGARSLSPSDSNHDSEKPGVRPSEFPASDVEPKELIVESTGTGPPARETLPPAALNSDIATDRSNSGDSSSGDRTREEPTPNRTDRRILLPHDPSANSEVVRHLVVGSAEDATIIEGTRHVSSFVAAIRELPNWPDVETIEVHDDEQVDEPLNIRHKRPLLIRGANGRNPQILFRPKSSTYSAKQTMMRLLGGDITFDGLHWRLELAIGAAEGWSLFRLELVNRLRFTKSTMTVENSGHQNVAFFSLAGSRISTMMIPAGANAALPTTTDIDLKECIARGQATFVDAVDGIAPHLTWDQGMLVTTERFLVAGGLDDRANIGQIEIDLRNVLIRADRGLASIETNEVTPNLQFAMFDLRNCVVLHDRNLPLYQHVGVETLDFARQSFRVDGKDNAYPTTNVFWSIRSASGEVREFTVESRNGEQWSLEQRSRGSMDWERPPRNDDQVHEHTPSDYLIAEADRRDYGFDASQLPVLTSK